MKKIVAIALFIVMVMTCTVVFAKTDKVIDPEKGITQYSWIRGGQRLHADKSLTGEILRTVPFNGAVTVYEIKGAWATVSYTSPSGTKYDGYMWASSLHDYRLKVDSEPAPTDTVPPTYSPT